MGKTKYPRQVAIDAARALCGFFEPVCERLIVAGSIRRMKPEVGDIEILYVPKFFSEPDGLFDTKQVNRMDKVLEVLLILNVIEKRYNVNGAPAWGAKNKLARCVKSGLPVDFFETNEAHFYNYLVCRTGPAESNVAIASAAQAKGWKWHPYGSGFQDEEGNLVPVRSEEDAFRLVGLPFKEPAQR